MKFCSSSRASASVCVTTDSMCSISVISPPAPRVDGLLKCPPTRLRIDFALPTYSTRRILPRKMYTPGASGSARRCAVMRSSRLCGAVSVAAIPLCRGYGGLGGSAPKGLRCFLGLSRELHVVLAGAFLEVERDAVGGEVERRVRAGVPGPALVCGPHRGAAPLPLAVGVPEAVCHALSSAHGCLIAREGRRQTPAR